MPEGLELGLDRLGLGRFPGIVCFSQARAAVPSKRARVETAKQKRRFMAAGPLT
jgi:hypothetical protein